MNIKFSHIKDAIKLYKRSHSPATLELKRLIAKNYVSTIQESQWDKISKSLFQQADEVGSPFVKGLSDMKEVFAKSDIEIPANVQNAFNYLEHKGSIFYERFQIAKSKSKTPLNTISYVSKFENSHRKELDILNDFIDKYDKDTIDPHLWLKFIDAKSKLSFLLLEDLYNPKIIELADGIVDAGQTFYHGTKHPAGILKQGFSLIPKSEQAAQASRELGQGVYLSPSSKVASRYADFFGKIIHTKVNTRKVAAVNNLQHESFVQAISDVLGIESCLSPMKLELIIRELFKRNGYNAAYSERALGHSIASMNKLVDDLAGGKQSQLVVFDPEDITIIKKTYKECLRDLMQQIVTGLKAPFIELKFVKELFLSS